MLDPSHLETLLANGTLTLDYYQPCPASPGASASMCCAASDTCQSNGLCWNSGYAIYWRESCSDPSWESSGCMKLFTNGTGKSYLPRLWGKGGHKATD